MAGVTNSTVNEGFQSTVAAAGARGIVNTCKARPDCDKFSLVIAALALPEGESEAFNCIPGLPPLLTFWKIAIG